MEEIRHDPRESRDRCLAAMDGADEETRVSLWRAALKYNERARFEAALGDWPQETAVAAVPEALRAGPGDWAERVLEW